MHKIIDQLTRLVSEQAIVAPAMGRLASYISSSAISGELYAIRRDEPGSGRFRWNSD